MTWVLCLLMLNYKHLFGLLCAIQSSHRDMKNKKVGQTNVLLGYDEYDNDDDDEWELNFPVNKYGKIWPTLFTNNCRNVRYVHLGKLNRLVWHGKSTGITHIYIYRIVINTHTRTHTHTHIQAHYYANTITQNEIAEHRSQNDYTNTH